MKILTNCGENWEEKESLWEAFRLDKKLKQRQEIEPKMAYVLAFVGGGGKTSSIYRLAAEGVKRGKKIIVMTTTHMLAPQKHSIFLENGQMDFEQVKGDLSEDGIIIVGDKINEKKMSFVGEEVYQELLGMAELILVEADGSRHFPIKVPASHEPVIPSKIDEIVCICGLSCYDKRASEVCFRLEQARKIRDRYEKDHRSLESSLSKEKLIIIGGQLEEKEQEIQEIGLEKNGQAIRGNQLEEKERMIQENGFQKEEWMIKEKDIMHLMREGFLEPLRQTEKNAKISMMLTQADTKELEKVGIDIFETMKEKGILIRKLPLVSEYKKI